jgi:putative salt-induced outer membrane protein
MKYLLFICVLAQPAFSATKEGFKNESEAGVVISSGNSSSESLSFKQNNSYGWDKNAFALKGAYLRTESAKVLSAKKWDSSLRYDRELSERFGVFAAQGLEADKFAGYRQRYNSDLGGKYQIVKEEKKWDWLAEAGYRYSRERLTNGSSLRKSEGRLYTEVLRIWSEPVSSKLWLEYLPSFSDSRDWLLNAELSLSVLLSSFFSLKSSYLVKYDNVPAAAAKSDRTFLTALVAKF